MWNKSVQTQKTCPTARETCNMNESVFVHTELSGGFKSNIQYTQLTLVKQEKLYVNQVAQSQSGLKSVHVSPY